MPDRHALRDAAAADTIRSITRAVGDLADEALMSFCEFEASERGDGRSAHLKERFAAMWLGSGLADGDPGPTPVPSMRVLAAMATLAVDPEAEVTPDAAAATIGENEPGWDPSWQMSDVRAKFEHRYGDFEKPPVGDWMKTAFGGLARANIALEAVEGGMRLSDPQEKLITEFAEYGRNAVGSDDRIAALHERQRSAKEKWEVWGGTAFFLPPTAALINLLAVLNDRFVWALPAGAAVLSGAAALYARFTKKGLDAANKALGAGQGDLRDSRAKLTERAASTEAVSEKDLMKLKANRGIRDLAVSRLRGQATR